MIITGNCLDILPTLDAESVDSIVTDPPYGLSFMGKTWDHGVPGVPFWIEALRVAKPGAFLLAFGGTRTHHRLMVAIEDAGWEIRDVIMWVYGSGFPKSLDVSKAIDKAAGAERESRVNERWAERYPNGPGRNLSGDGRSDHYGQCKQIIGNPLMTSTPATDAARQWEGWGTALKPAWEPIIVARKPLVGTVAANVLKYGTGAMNIDGCRIPLDGDYKCRANGRPSQTGLDDNYDPANANQQDTKGRWPANLIHDGSGEVLACFPDSRGQCAAVTGNEPSKPALNVYGEYGRHEFPARNDSGSAARFFYCAKASKQDRDEGCKGLEAGITDDGRQTPIDNPYLRGKTERRNTHPTVKPTSLMLYLCRLVTRSGGTILDMFCGSGSTGKAAEIGGFDFIGIDEDGEATEISEKRINAVKLPLFDNL